MQALLDVFDTNHNGKLDSGDAKFSQFRLVVTGANGTQRRWTKFLPCNDNAARKICCVNTCG